MLAITLILAVGVAYATSVCAEESKDLNLDDVVKMRDPFKRSADLDQQVERTELELYPLDRMKVAGVITGAKRMRAMLVTPDGRTHFVSEGMKLGDRGGVITRITDKGIRIRERTMNVLGQEEVEELDLLLPKG